MGKFLDAVRVDFERCLGFYMSDVQLSDVKDWLYKISQTTIPANKQKEFNMDEVEAIKKLAGEVYNDLCKERTYLDYGLMTGGGTVGDPIISASAFFLKFEQDSKERLGKLSMQKEDNSKSPKKGGPGFEP